jgi:hypothetical protein
MGVKVRRTALAERTRYLVVTWRCSELPDP